MFADSASLFHYLDSAATSQIHRTALEAVVHHETRQRANVMRGTYRLAEAATEAYEAARAQTSCFLNAAMPEEIVFTSGATASLNLVAYAFGATLCTGDEIVISLAEHHSNFVPWQMLRDRRGIVLKFLPLTCEGRIDTSALRGVVTQRCRLIALTHCSNVTGAITDVPAVVAAARAVGARVLLDGAQRVQHGPVDVQELGVDFYAFSGHKCYGPSGIGVLWGRADVLDTMPPFLGGGGMVGEVTPTITGFVGLPQRFEAGTPPIAAAVGLGATLDWMMTLPWSAIHAHEQALLNRLLQGLANVRDLRLLGPSDATARQPIVSFELNGLHPHDVCQVLDHHGIALRGGHLCAQPLMHHFGVNGANRASIAPYTTEEDIDALLSGLAIAIRVLT